jgi:hypothetical protein
MGKIYERIAKRVFFIKEICFFILGGYALKIADTYSFATNERIAVKVAVAIVIMVSWFIIADSLGTMIVSFIKWIKGDYHKNNDSTDRSTIREAGQKNTNSPVGLFNIM